MVVLEILEACMEGGRELLFTIETIQIIYKGCLKEVCYSFTDNDQVSEQ